MRRQFTTTQWLLLLGLMTCTGCGPGTAALAAFAVGSGFGFLWISQRRAELALHQAASLRLALESGQQRTIEGSLRRRLAMSEQGGVSPERQWLARAQLGGLLVAEWRLEEASQIYAADDADAPPILRSLAVFGRHEIATLRAAPTPDLLDQIRKDKDTCLTTVPAAFRGQAGLVWDALEGLCLARMGSFHEAIPLLRAGVDQVLDLTPARIVYIYHLAQSYERVGELSEAHRYYELAASASPGTRLASEASSRHLALGPAGERGGFRGMLPEAPALSNDVTMAPPSAAADSAGHPDPLDPAAEGDEEKRRLDTRSNPDDPDDNDGRDDADDNAPGKKTRTT